MKKYLLFAGYSYYPSGGWKDYQGSFETTEEACRVLLKTMTGGMSYDWAHVVDTQTDKIIELT